MSRPLDPQGIGRGQTLLALGLLVLLGDHLFRGHRIGITPAIFVWTIFTTAALDRKAPLSWRAGERPVLGLNSGSVLRALLLFNGFLFVQSALDISLLIAGGAVPQGMSHASYAHRGADPLLGTAMLAGAFALVARPFSATQPALKPLLLIWLAQNILLTASAALRLELYIDTFGLTYLRLHALIWMRLVAAGLAMVVWQVLGKRSTPWFLLRVGAIALPTRLPLLAVRFSSRSRPCARLHKRARRAMTARQP